MGLVFMIAIFGALLLPIIVPALFLMAILGNPLVWLMLLNLAVIPLIPILLPIVLPVLAIGFVGDWLSATVWPWLQEAFAWIVNIWP